MTERRSLEQRIAALERRTARMIQVGVVSEVDCPNKRIRVDVGERTSAWLRFTTQRAGADRTWWPPTEGEQVMVFAPGGEMVTAVVGDSLYQQAHDAPADSEQIRRTVYGNGTTVELDQDSGALKVTHPGDIEVSADGGATVAAGGDVAVNAGGDLTLEAAGNVTIKGSRVDLNP